MSSKTLSLFTACICVLGISACTHPTHADTLNTDTNRTQLVQQYQAIVRQAQSVPCTDASEWRITPIGKKACGGPAAYIAYSSRIDTARFLQQVAAYTAASDRYNRNSGMASDCMMVTEPQSVQCVNGQAVLHNGHGMIE